VDLKVDHASPVARRPTFVHLERRSLENARLGLHLEDYTIKIECAGLASPHGFRITAQTGYRPRFVLAIDQSGVVARQ